MKEIKNILICGAGMMGKNIGYVFASNPSFQVGMYDLYPTDVEAGIRTNTRQLHRGHMLEAAGRLVPELRVVAFQREALAHRAQELCDEAQLVGEGSVQQKVCRISGNN